MSYKESVGIIGGFGAYATLDFYRRFLEKFKCECERDYPHIYMDNDFTMPSRTRALLYGEGYSEVVEKICCSIKGMLDKKADYIVMVCGTAHAFLPDVYVKVPEAKKKIFNIISCLDRKLKKEKVTKIVVLAAEGTLKNKVYQNQLEAIECISPDEKYYSQIRYFIESVKQNKINREVARKWYEFISTFECENILLGCTELPVLVKFIEENFADLENGYYCYYDPLEAVLDELKIIMQ